MLSKDSNASEEVCYLQPDTPLLWLYWIANDYVSSSERNGLEASKLTTAKTVLHSEWQFIVSKYIKHSKQQSKNSNGRISV